MSHARFQAISNAYAILSGKKISSSSTNTLDHDTPYHEEVLRRKRAQWRASAGSDEFGHSGPSLWERQEREKFDQAALVFVIVLVCDLFFFIWEDDNILLICSVFFPSFRFFDQALAAAVLPISVLSPFVAGRQRHDEAAKNLADARRAAKDVSEIRRLATLQRKNNLDISEEKERMKENVG